MNSISDTPGGRMSKDGLVQAIKQANAQQSLQHFLKVSHLSCAVLNR